MKHRHAPLLAGLVALGYAVEGAIVVRAPQPEHGWHASGYAVEAAFVVALLASLPLVGPLRPGPGRATAAGAWLTRAGFAAMLVSAVVSLAAGGDELGPAFFLGVLATLAGLLTLSVVAVRRRESDWWTAPAVTLGLVGSMALGDHGGGILLGLAWAATAIAFRDAEPANGTVAAVA
jgi:hypothetical protein